MTYTVALDPVGKRVYTLVFPLDDQTEDSVAAALAANTAALMDALGVKCEAVAKTPESAAAVISYLVDQRGYKFVGGFTMRTGEPGPALQDILRDMGLDKPAEVKPSEPEQKAEQKAAAEPGTETPPKTNPAA